MVRRIPAEGGGGSVVKSLASSEYGVIATFIRDPQLENQLFGVDGMVGRKVDDVRLQDLAWPYLCFDLTYKFAIWPLQQAGHDRRFTPIVAGGGPNADFGDGIQPLVQGLFYRLLGPHRPNRIDDVIGGSRNEAGARQQAEQEPETDEGEDRGG